MGWKYGPHFLTLSIGVTFGDVGVSFGSLDDGERDWFPTRLLNPISHLLWGHVWSIFTVSLWSFFARAFLRRNPKTRARSRSIRFIFVCINAEFGVLIWASHYAAQLLSTELNVTLTSKLICSIRRKSCPRWAVVRLRSIVSVVRKLMQPRASGIRGKPTLY